MRQVEFWQGIDIWAIAVTVAIVVLGKIVIVYVALRGAQPADRPRIIAALAELFRWWRNSSARAARK